MPTELSSQGGTSLSFTLQPELFTSLGTSDTLENSDGLISTRSSSTGEENSTGSSSRRLRPSGHGHSQSHSHRRSHSHMHAEADCSHPDVGEPSASFSELRYLFCWVQKSLPFIIILCSKLILQHVLGKHVKKKEFAHNVIIHGWSLSLV